VTDEAALPSTNRKTRVIRKVLIVLAVIVALLVVASLVLLVMGWVSSSRASEEVRARGEPLHVRDIQFLADAPASDLAERLAQLSKAFEDSADLLMDPMSLDESLERVRAWAPAADALPMVESFVDCARTSSPTDQKLETFDFDALAALIEDPGHATTLTDCQKLGLRVKQRLAEPLVDVAEAVCRANPESGERWTRGWQPKDGPVPPEKYVRVMVAARVLMETAPALAMDGRPDEAIRRMNVAMQGGRTIRGMPWLLAHLAWVSAVRNAVRGLQITLPFLPRAADLSSFARELDASAPRSNLERALIGERAFGNDILEGAFDFGGIEPSWRLSITRLWLSLDRAFFLRRMSAAVEQAKRPFFEPPIEVRPWEKDSTKFPRWALGSSMVLPRLDSVFQHTAKLEAQLLLARAAITAFSEGAEAGARVAANSIDPFDGKPLRTRIESDGTLVMWSIGIDRVDNGAGPDPRDEDEQKLRGPLDIVWRVKPR
jgi:hypothetical protein